MSKGCIVLAGLVISTLGACAECPEGQRPRGEALELARQFAQESFSGNAQREFAASELEVVTERYEPSDRFWHFEIASTDGNCIIDVAVGDCRPMESAGGGGCGNAHAVASGDA
jgi:hypothetical protein